MNPNDITYLQIICPKCGKVYYDSRTFYIKYNEAIKYCKFCGVYLVTKHLRLDKNKNVWEDKPE